MGYIIKENQGLLVTRLTDVGRRKISEGNFNVAYFQIGDSEVNYTALSNYDNSDYMVLEPPYNAQNNVGIPQSTRTDIKYPFYLQGFNGITYGIPFMASADDSVYNTAAPNGFFQSGVTCYSPYHTSAYTYNSQYVTNLASSSFNGGSSILTMVSSPCNDSASGTTISAGTFVTIYMSGGSSCGCIASCHPILTYRVISVNGLNITLDSLYSYKRDMNFNNDCNFYQLIWKYSQLGEKYIIKVEEKHRKTKVGYTLLNEKDDD